MVLSQIKKLLTLLELVFFFSYYLQIEGLTYPFKVCADSWGVAPPRFLYRLTTGKRQLNAGI